MFRTTLSEALSSWSRTIRFEKDATSVEHSECSSSATW
jgi:hypothetical protein